MVRVVCGSADAVGVVENVVGILGADFFTESKIRWWEEDEKGAADSLSHERTADVRVVQVGGVQFVALDGVLMVPDVELILERLGWR